MAILPRRLEDLLTFMDNHANAWSTVFAQIGISSQQAAVFQDAATKARDAYNARKDADDAARAATLSQRDAVRDARRTCQDLIDLIKAFANTSANPTAVLNAAQLPPPAPPTPMPAPGQPTDISVGIDPTLGSIQLAWKCINPEGASGTAYIVRRKTPTQSEWTFVGVTGKKNFTDASFIAGPDRVQYTVQAQRSDAAGPVSNILEVNFGLPGGGGLTIVSQSMAA